MCEIFSTIGASVLAGIGISGASAAATTATGVATVAATAGSLASTGLGIANSVRSAKAANAQVRAMDNNAAAKVTTASEKTAMQLQENQMPKRTLTSLRIPLEKTANASAQSLNTNTAATGLNIPM